MSEAPDQSVSDVGANFSCCAVTFTVVACEIDVFVLENVRDILDMIVMLCYNNIVVAEAVILKVV